VGVRLRPFVGYERGQKQVLTIRDKVVSVVAEVAGKEAKDFAFDQAMDSTDPQSPQFVGQEKCYELMASRMVGHIFQGYNTCLFCYGQTGTGKTTTIMGSSSPESEQGLLLRLLSDVFKESAKIQSTSSAEVHMKVQMLEVYNEHINDLLLPHGSGKDHKADVHVHPTLGVYIKGVTEEAVETSEKCIKLIDYGNTMKTVAATAMNAKSSRSHTVFKLMVEKKGGVDNMTIMSEVFFVDLAGRENEKTTKVAGERLVELTFINRSLMWLSTCIQSLGQDSRRKSMAPRKSMAAGMDPRKSAAPGEGGPRKSVAPGSMAKDMSKFRNSKLTLLLSNALSGNSKTAMIGTLSPALLNFEESFSTLNFANTVKNIKVEAKVASAVDKESLVQSLQDEVKQLKEQLARERSQDGEPDEDTKEKLESTEALCTQYQKKWEDSKQESQELMAKREEAMEKLGIARWKLAATKAVSKFASAREREPENLLPYLANFSDDPHLCGRFVLHPAEVQRDYAIGFGDEADFKVPPGLGVSSKTCYIKRDFGRLFIRAVERRMSVTVGGTKSQSAGRVEVNGTRIHTEWVELQHQDCVVLGRSLMYYAFTESDGGIQALPMEKRFANGYAGNESSESLINSILGPGRASDRDQMQLAREYYNQMQKYNLDTDGAQLLHNFLLQAQRAKKMVEEANDITAEVKPDSGLRFELTAIAPLLAFGFGHACFPDFCVRLVREIPKNQSSRRLTIERMRRQSVQSNVEMLRKFTMDGERTVAASEEAAIEVLYTWHFPKFTSRLQLMQDARESWTEDPDNFVLDPHEDPWCEYGIGEIAQIRADSHDDLSKSREEIRRLREGSRDTTLCHELLTQSNSPRNQEKNERNSALIQEVLSLREALRLKDLENARLRQEVERIKAEAIQRLSSIAQSHKTMAAGVISDGVAHAVGEVNDMHVEARRPRPNNGEDWVAASSHAKHCLEVSKANLSLVEDLFRLSISLLRAGTTCLQVSTSDNGAMDVSSSARNEQARLAAAASDLVAFFSNAGAFPRAASGPQLSVGDFYKQQQVNRQVSAPTSFTSCSGQPGVPSYLVGPARNGFSTPVMQAPPMVAAPYGMGSGHNSPTRGRPMAATNNGLDVNLAAMQWQTPGMMAQASPMRSRPMVMSPNQAAFLA